MSAPTNALCGSKSLEFEIIAADGRARATRLAFNSCTCFSPMFMPVGTQGSIKGLTSKQMEEVGCQMILGNTYHLENRPGSSLLQHLGGLSSFVDWNRSSLTDSGGFQMVSLLDLADISEKGVSFQSPIDGKQMLLTPERSMRIQNRIGANVIMALDDVVSSVCLEAKRFEEATHRTLRWIDRCIAAHQKPSEQALFGIIQGGVDLRLRSTCIEEMNTRDAHLPGYAIGGLAGGEEKDAFCRVVAQCASKLPVNKPRYVMGVGYPLDLVVCSALGADLYDCVYPSRTARFGTALVPEGTLRLKTAAMAADYRPIDDTCDCLVCQKYSRAHLHAKITKEPHAASLLTYHNIRYQMRLCDEMRQAIISQQFQEFVQSFVRKQFPNNMVPEWLREGLSSAEITV